MRWILHFSLDDLYHATERVDALLAEHHFVPEYAFSAVSTCDVSTSSLPTGESPISVHQALAGPDSSHWFGAMQSEYASLIANRTWSLVPLPSNRNTISCKWILRRKLNSDGTIARYKARLVARGFSQVEGLDYNETFSPVLRMASFRILLALATYLNFEIHHLDVQTAFLHGDLPEEIYMEQPQHFVDPERPQYVCRLHRSLYGLKQSPRLWFQCFNTFMLQHGYYRLLSEPNIYIRHTSTSFLIVALYVDDIPLIGSSASLVTTAIK